MFWAGPNVFVPDQKFIYILWQSQTFCARQKDDLHSVKLVFCAGTKVFEEALNIVKFLGWFKKFGLAQNILGPEKGQGIRLTLCLYSTLKFNTKRNLGCNLFKINWFLMQA